MNASLTWNDIYGLSPLLIILAGSLILLLVESYTTQFAKRFSWVIALITLLIALIPTYISIDGQHPLLTPWIRFDEPARFFSLLFLIIGIASTLLAASFFKRFEDEYKQLTHGEYYFLLLSSVVGLLLIASAADFLILFLGLETLSIALYVMCGYMKRWEFSHEAAMKYFLMGALGASFLIYGIALIYGAIGTTQFAQLIPAFKAISSSQHAFLFYGGIALLTVGLAFKAAIVPFHVWAPDVYDGAPNPVTAFMSVGTKAGAFAAFAVVFLLYLPQFSSWWNEGMAILAIPTLLYANYVALQQTQLRRFFAYSGISHAGYMLIPIAAGTPDALPALEYYLIVYSLATLGAFAVLAFLDNKSEGVQLEDLRGLFRRSPLLAGILALSLLTLAGIPPTAGFFAKLYILKVGFDAGYYVLVLIALLVTILSAYYYLRVVSVMLSESVDEGTPPYISRPAYVVGVLCVAGIVLLSVYPQPLMSGLNMATAQAPATISEEKS